VTKNAGTRPLEFFIATLEANYPRPYLDDQTRVNGKAWSEIKEMAMQGGSELDQFKASCNASDQHTLGRLVEAQEETKNMEPLVTSKFKDKHYRESFDSVGYFALVTALYE
jgi:hypothetical protein